MAEISRAPEGWEGDWPPPPSKPQKVKEFPRTIASLTRSQEFLKLTPKDREALVRDFMQASEQQQNDFLLGLTYKNPMDKPMVQPSPKPLKDVAKDSAAQAIDTTLSGVGAGIGTFLGHAPGGVAGGAAGAVAADRINRGLGLRDPEQADIPFAGLVNQGLGANLPTTTPNKPIATIPGTSVEVTTGDLLAAAPDVLQGGARAFGRLQVRPALKALDKYNQGVARSQGTGNTALADADQHAITTNEKNLVNFQNELDAHQNKMDAWQLRGNQLTREYLQDRQKILDDTTRTNTQRDADFQLLTQNYQKALAEHNRAAKTLPQEGLTAQGLFDKVGNHEAYYNQAQGLARQAKPVDISPFRQTANELNVSLSQPADPLQNPFRRVTEALAGFEGTEAVPLERLIETQKKLGKIVGSSSGEVKGAAKKLYSSLDNVMEAHAATDPKAAEAIAAQKEASLRFKRGQTVQDWLEMWQNRPGVRDIGGHNTEVNAQSLRDQFMDWMHNDRFASSALTPEEFEHMYQTIERAPQSKLGSAPEKEAPATPIDALRELDYRRQQEVTRVQEAYPGSGPDMPPAQVEPDYSGAYSPPPVRGSGGPAWGPELGNVPLGDAILSKVTVSEGLPRVMGMAGSMPGAGLAAAGIGVALPHWVAAALLNNESRMSNGLRKYLGINNRTMLQGILDGSVPISEAQRAAMVGFARSLSRTEDAENYQNTRG